MWTQRRRDVKDALIKARIPKDLKEAARRKAEREGLTLSEALRRLLAEWVAKEPPPLENEST